MENRKMKKEYICPILTILKDENTVDFDAMHKLYDRLIKDGISEIALLVVENSMLKPLKFVNL